MDECMQPEIAMQVDATVRPTTFDTWTQFLNTKT